MAIKVPCATGFGLRPLHRRI